MAGNKVKVTAAIAVTPSDTVDIKPGSIGLNIGASGVVAVVFAAGTDAVALTVSAGDSPYEVSRVMATGTTATGIVALY